MAEIIDIEEILRRIRTQANTEEIRITQHAHQEMAEEGITLDEVLEAIASGDVLENYHKHRRGACCLLNGLTKKGRPLHIVCTTTMPVLIIITVYEPKPPKWVTPAQRRQ
jgi:diphthamide synthase (EF-2-diphthine--ammonia ligase)